MENIKVYENLFFFCDYPHMWALIDFNIISDNMVEYSLRDIHNFDILEKSNKKESAFFEEFFKLIEYYYLPNKYNFGNLEVRYDPYFRYTGYRYKIKAEKSNYMRIYVKREKA